MEPVVDPAVFDPRLAQPDLTLPARGTLVAERYRVGEDIGVGGMSIVFSARDERLGRDVAIKLLNPRLAYSREIVTRFVNEARTLAQLDCPHVVRVFDAGVTHEPGQPPLPFMVLELLHGVELRHSVTDPGQADIKRVVGWMLQVCEGLAAAHVEGIIHRDLKPENLFVVFEPDGSQVVKVLDFGIARSMQVPASAALDGDRMGSPGYMSPEQIKDVRSVDQRSDIWSLGVILYELLAGIAPFRAASPGELCVQILNAPVVPLRSLRPEVPPGLAAVVQRCLQRRVEARFENIAELAEALSPHAHPNAAEMAVRIRRRLSSRATTTVAAALAVPAGTSLALEPRGPPERGAQPGIPKRPPFLAAQNRYVRPLALGAVAVFLAFFTATMLQGGAARPRAFVTIASARLAAAAQGLLGKGE